MNQKQTLSLLTLTLVIVAVGAVWLSKTADDNAAVPGPPTAADVADAAATAALVDPELAPYRGDLDGIRKRGVLRALVTPSRTDFFIDDGEIRGLQAEFLYRLVDQLNKGVGNEADRVRLKFVPVPFNELITSLEAGRGDLIAAFLTATPERQARIDVASTFRLSADEVIVTHVDVDPPASLEGLAGRTIMVLKGSSYEEHLRELSAQLTADGGEPIDVRAAQDGLYTDDILELVNAGAVPMTLVDDYAAQLWARVLPDIRVHPLLAVSQDNALGWGLPPDTPQLHDALAGFARKVRQGSLIGNILFQRYFEDTGFIDNPLAEADRDRLERLLPLFQEYGDRYGIDPLALAAQAYQESSLDHEARSHRGAVGLMQLLPSTARDPQVGIPDISTPEDNVHAGARYLAFLRDHYFSEAGMTEADRRAFAWAAYNAGPRAITRMRARATRLGLDPDVWFGQTEVATAGGIGREPVRYVANIQKYYLAYRFARAQRADRDAQVRERAAASSY